MTARMIEVSVQRHGGNRTFPVAAIDIVAQKGQPPPGPDSAQDLLNNAAFAKNLAGQIVKISGIPWMYAQIDPGGVGAEIGVDHGDNVEGWASTDPKMVYLVDPWKSGEIDGWWCQEQEFLDWRYELVKLKARKYGHDKFCVVRKTSDDFFASMPDDSLDWVYIDGDHLASQVVRDLCNSLRCVRDGGQIFGDDLHCNIWSRQIEGAMQEFIMRHGKNVELVHSSSDPFLFVVHK